MAPREYAADNEIALFTHDAGGAMRWENGRAQQGTNFRSSISENEPGGPTTLRRWVAQ